jgi:hypothetical protein
MKPGSCPKAPGGGPCVLSDVATGAELIRWITQCTRCGWVDPTSLDERARQAHGELMDGAAQRCAMAAGVEPFAFVQQTGVRLTFLEGISQAMTAVALAWERPEAAGGYNAERAKEIGADLYKLHREFGGK